MPTDEEAPTHVLADRDLEPLTQTKQTIGPYRLLEPLGEGGMGEVWLAEQESPRRKVALKLIKRGMDTQMVVARFEAERQALALMDHTNIAKVFGAGETEIGTPYFAMEFVEGLPITDYCDRNRLSTRHRLELFLAVCRGVQHAHQKAVIHRDLKPSNILVTEEDGQPVPKIIDFGIAKAINLELTERTLFTQLGQIVGTPEYMAPEQAQMFDADVDTRVDVYSLGVLLYELLAGARPFSSSELRKAGLAEIHRQIREVEPPKPSTRVSSLGDSDPRVAELRQTDLGSLIRVLRGDLDWITMKALEKDRDRRYESVDSLQQEVRRHLDDEPVQARPPSRLYRLRKFVRRNQLAASAAVAVALALIVGISVASWQAVEARRAERRAQQEAQRADRQALTSDRVTQFLLSLFRSGDPYLTAGEETIGEVLDRGLDQLDELSGEPLVQSDLLITLGDAMINTGRRDEGNELIGRALGIREQVLDGEDPDLLYYRWFAADRGSTGPIDEQWVELANATYRGLLPREDFVSRNRRSEMLLSLAAGSLLLDNDLDAARPRMLEALDTLEALERETGQRFKATPTAIENLGFVAIMQADLEEAKKWYDRGLAYSERVHGKDHVRYAQSLGQYATLLRDMQRFDEAERAAIEAYERRLRALGGETGNVAYDIGVVTSIYRGQGQLDEAERWARELLAVARRIDQGVDMGTCVLSDILGAQAVLGAQSVPAEARSLLEEAGTLDADQEFHCRRARGLLLIAEGEAAAGDAILTDLWEQRRQRDPVNLSVRAMPIELEAAHRRAGNDDLSNAWAAAAAAHSDEVDGAGSAPP